MPLKDNKKLLKQWKNHKSISEGALDDQYSEARNDHAFFAGDQMAYTATVADKGRKTSVVFNKVKPYIDAVAGFMVQLRRKPNYLARIQDNAQQQELSTYLNALSNYARENANLDHLETRQDREMLIAGYGAIDTNIVYDCNPDGEPKAENIDYNDIGWDPQAREPNLLDSRWVYRRKKFSLEEAKKRFSNFDEEDFKEFIGDSNESYQYNPIGGTYDKIAIGAGGKEEVLVEIYYYQYWDLETYYRCENPLFEIQDEFLVNQIAQFMEAVRVKRTEEVSYESVEDYFEFDPFDEYLIMTPSIKSDVQTIFSRFNIDLECQAYQKKVYYTAIITGETILDKFRSLDQQGFTIKFKTGDYDHENERWFGMVAALKQPARYANKALTEMLYVIASNSKGGVMYEETAVENPAKFEQQWATTKAAIKVADGAVSGGRIAPKAVASLPNGYENVYAISSQSMGEVTGVNKEFLGNSNNTQVSALFESQRINQVVSTLACYFDSIALYQKEHARLMITYLRVLAENSEGRLVKILTPEGAARFEVISSDRLSEEYDVDIQEAPQTPTQKQETTQLIMSVADKLALLGQNIYPVAVQYLPIEQKDKQKLLEILTPPAPTPEEQAMQQMAQELQMQGQAAEIAKVQGDVALKQAQTAKTAAEIEKVDSEIDATDADTMKTYADTEQKNLENMAMRDMSINNLDVII
jgi:hypothetical protein